jgi:uncharacterized protein (DUF1015 family)
MTEPNDVPTTAGGRGLSLAPFRATRYLANGPELGRLLCPPYDVIDKEQRADLLRRDPANAVQLILPVPDGDASQARPYEEAADTLDGWIAQDVMSVDAAASLYVYEMTLADGSVTRGLLGAVELRDYDDQVILPHENTMAGPVADRLALMTATEANLEPIYLVYDGGGAASKVVAGVDASPLVETKTPDGTTHRLWAISDPEIHAAVDADLNERRALIADGHHRYATYLELQRERSAERGPGPWDRGLALLVDSSSYGPQVHAIHRVLAGVTFADAVSAIRSHGTVSTVTDVEDGLRRLTGIAGFAAVLADGDSVAVIQVDDEAVVCDLLEPNEPDPMAALDVTVLHRGLLPRVWRVPDSEENVRYAHDVAEAIELARSTSGTAVLLRPTPVDAVAAVAAAGARMPRKSTLFTPKPASGMVIRRFVDQVGGEPRGIGA